MTLMKISSQKKIVLTYILPLISLLVLNPNVGFSQSGANLFEKHCRVCHHIGEGKLVGPDLLGVEERREREWIASFIENSQKMIQEGDPIAVQVYQENKKAIMPSFTQLSSIEINSIIDYITNWMPVEKEVFTVDINKKTGFKHDEILRGERLFYGLIRLEDNSIVNCTNCHNTETSDSLNWNPSAIDLAKSFIDRTGMNIYESMTQPSSDLMEKSHNFKMNEQEIYYISAYLSELSNNKLEDHKIFPIKLMLFILFAVLMTLALIDLLFTRIIKYKIVHGLVLLIGISVHAWLAYHEATNLSRTQGYAPDQPIKFSHEIHAGENKIDCRYCHHTADYSKSAYIPSANVCMNCHNVVKTGKNSGNFEINKITRAIKNGTPIQWVRVHNLPDYTFFSHAQHVNVGKLDCQVCHGNVENMHIVEQANDLSMGWCINCHRDTEVQFEANKYYSIFKDMESIDKSGSRNPIHVEDVGGIDCMKCHY